MAKAHDLGLPETLGFGKLDTHSVRAKDGKLYARYLLKDEVVYRIYLGKKCCLKEFYEGRLIAQTDQQGLEACFLHHMKVTQPYQHPRFLDFLNLITGAANILMFYETSDRLACYPGGSGFLFHQPVIEENHRIRDELRLFIEDRGELSPVRHLAPQRGYIFRGTDEGDVDIEEVEIQNYGTQLPDLLDAVALLWGNGLIPEQREYRMEVAEMPVSLKGLFFVHGTAPGSRYRTYSVIREEDDSPLDLEITADIFSEHSMRYIERVDAEAS